MPAIPDVPILFSQPPPAPHSFGRAPPSPIPAFITDAALPLAGVTVLLVEDSRFASDALRLMCRRSGARLRRADCLAQARTHLSTYHPDVVIVDLGLPDGRGEELIEELRRAAAEVVLFGLSGDPQGERAALCAGANAFLAKPLPSLGAFQKLLLRYLPPRFALASDGGAAVVAPDPMSLRDDLTYAAQLLAREGEGSGQWQYISAFLSGVGRSAGDRALIAAAERLIAPSAGRAALMDLNDVVAARLRGLRGDRIL